MQYATVNDDPNFYLNATPAMIEQFFNEQTPETLQNLLTLKYKSRTVSGYTSHGD